MEITRKVQAGTMQSSDLMIFLEPAPSLAIEIESTVKKQFEHLIRAKIEDVLKKHDITTGLVRITDRGALDYAIEARMESALQRAAQPAR